MKQPLTPKKAQALFLSMQTTAILAELISIEYHNVLIDTKFKNPAINQHAKRIKESSEAIRLHLAALLDTKDREFFAYDYCVELSVLFKFFTTMPLEQIQDTIKQIEELNKEAV